MNDSCPNCGCPVEVRTSGIRAHGGLWDTEGYHDVLGCIRFLKSRIELLAALLAGK